MPATSQPNPGRRRRTYRLLATAATLATVGALAAALPADAHDGRHGKPLPSRYQDVQLLSFNDLHGNLEPPSGSSGVINTLDPVTGAPVPVTAGGVAYLATHLQQARVGHPNSLTVAAGDLIGGSPLLSAAFHDEPTIEAMNALKLDVTTVGNHEFDEGSTELLRMQNGGCRTNPDGTPAADSCPAGPGSFTG